MARTRGTGWLGLVLWAGCSGQQPSPADARHEPAPPAPQAANAPAPKDPDNVGVPLPGIEVCATHDDGSLKNPIPEGTYTGLLRMARCDQQKFLTMARIAAALGVECRHCHVPDPNDPKKELYAESTDNKRIAGWMHDTFVRGLSPVDGSQIQCSSCHTGPDGKPLAKILQSPRNRDFAQEWMHEVMTTRFVEANGKRLKCLTCHVGMAPDTEGWIKDVVRKLRYEPTEGVSRPAEPEGT